MDDTNFGTKVFSFDDGCFFVVDFSKHAAISRLEKTLKDGFSQSTIARIVCKLHKNIQSPVASFSGLLLPPEAQSQRLSERCMTRS